MPRRGENIYKRKDGRWEGRILKQDGMYRYVYAKTYRGVKAKKKEYFEKSGSRADRDYGRGQNPALPFEIWLDENAAGRVKPSTYESYYCCMKKYVIPFFRKRGGRITESSAARFAESVMENRSLSEPYKRKILSVFKTALREILKGSAECESILSAIVLPKAKGRTVQAFSVQEQGLIEKAALESGDVRSLGILLCFYTGIRLGELCALKWSDIDFGAGTLSITKTVSRIRNFRQNGNKTTLTVGTPKSETSVRKIPMPDFLLKLFSDSGKSAAGGDRFLFSGTCLPLDPRTYQKLYKRILARAGVKDRKFHAIRHTFATRALELGVDIKTLSEILGHSNVSVTLNIYAHSLMEQKRVAIEKLNKMHVNHMEIPSFAVTRSVSSI